MDMNEQWSSTGLSWDTRVIDYSEYLKYDVNDEKYIRYEIGDFVKRTFDDPTWLEESHGFLLTAEEENCFAIFATSDNSLYPPFVRIDTYELPQSFKQQDEINPVS